MTSITEYRACEQCGYREGNCRCDWQRQEAQTRAPDRRPVLPAATDPAQAPLEARNDDGGRDEVRTSQR
jgi:hypothetical protein